MQKKVEEWLNPIQFNELVEGINNCPHDILGSHIVDDGQIITAYRPYAWGIKVVSLDGKEEDWLDRYENSDLFGIYFDKVKYKEYKLVYQFGENDIVETEDPYSFEPFIGDMDLHLFAEGNHYQIYEKLGAHPMTINGISGTYFAVWAPHARSVSVVGTFNFWDGQVHPMRVLGVAGVYELFIPRVGVGEIYKYQIRTRDGEILLKSDPYATSSELRPKNASVVADISKFDWTDDKWIKERLEADRMECRKKPMSIYEVHLGSWRKKEDGTEDGFYNYREIAPQLADYMIDMGYTHAELIGIAEHPLDASWGYQVTGYYAPTKRYGQPDDFMYFVDYMHSRGLYIILDWVPAHFPRDAHGLANFDGAPLYEHPDKRRGEHPHWGTLIFNYGMKEVENFLMANALYWIEKFHIDGLRVDAVASMLYLDYGKNDGEWLPNEKGGRENLDVIRLLRHMNQILEERVPGALLIAEESTAWAGVTAPVSLGGLGFVFKWNMGWMNDFLEYMKLDPYFRKFNHHKLTFSMMYAYSENFIQVLSHDEVVHGKCSMINKMPGEYLDKFANLRTAYGFMWGHPGKKLLFMGQEFAQFNEWNEAKSLDWELLEEEKNVQMKEYVKALNHLYKSYDALYCNDYDPIGFEWMSCDDAERSIVAFVRRGKTSKNQLLFVCNFTPVWRKEFCLAVPCKGKYTEILNSDDEKYGGGGEVHLEPIKAEEIENEESEEREYSICFNLPALSTIVFSYDYIEEEKKKVNKVLKQEVTSQPQVKLEEEKEDKKIKNSPLKESDKKEIVETKSGITAISVIRKKN